MEPTSFLMKLLGLESLFWAFLNEEHKRKKKKKNIKKMAPFNLFVEEILSFPLSLFSYLFSNL